MNDKQLARYYMRSEAIAARRHGWVYMGNNVFEALTRLIHEIGRESDRQLLIDELEKFEYQAYPKAVKRKDEMRIIVAGSQRFRDYKFLKEKLDHLTKKLPYIVILSGTANGADTLGEEWAFERLRVDPARYGTMAKKFRRRRRKLAKRGMNFKYGHVERYHPNWKKYKKRAGIIRNKEMIKKGKADALVAFWDGESPGTKNMIYLAKKYGLKVRVYIHDCKLKPLFNVSQAEPKKKKLKLRFK